MGRSVDPRDHLIVALDTPSLAEADALAEGLEDLVRWFKIGPHLFTAAGPAAVAAIARRGRIFLDLKFHDIPSIVAAAVAGARRLGVALCTVHAAGGSAMLRAAREAAEHEGTAQQAGRPGAGRMRIVAVTLLTSVDAPVLQETGVTGSPLDAVVRLARLAQAAGADGAVTSPHEAGAVRAACGGGFLIVCPGVRPAGTGAGDQRRVLTPRAAIAAGADYLVVGRPITEAADPRTAAEKILQEIAAA